MFLNILAIMSFCDAMASLGVFLSVARQLDSDTSTYACIAQGIIGSFFPKASVSWTVALSLQLYSIVKYSKPYFSEVYMHLVFWFVPLIFELLPIFAGQTLGNGQKSDFFQLCFITPPNDSQRVVDIIFALGFPLVGILCLLFLYFLIVKAFNADSNNASFFKLREVLNVLQLYPVAIILLQLPILTSIGIEFFKPLSDSDGARAMMNDIVVSIFAFYSIFTAIIFFYGSKDARDRWRVLFCELRIDNSLRPIAHLRTSLYNVAHADIRISAPDSTNSSRLRLSILSREYVIADNDIEESEPLNALHNEMN